MCLVSNIGDHWKDNFPEKWPQFVPHVPTPANPYPIVVGGPSKEEFAALLKEVQELKKLLKAAKEYDEKTGQPHCEVDEKVALIKAVAKLVGVDLGDLFPKETKA